MKYLSNNAPCGDVFSLSDSLFASSSPTTRAQAAQSPAASTGRAAGAQVHSHCRAGGTACQGAGSGAVHSLEWWCSAWEKPPQPWHWREPSGRPSTPWSGSVQQSRGSTWWPREEPRVSHADAWRHQPASDTPKPEMHFSVLALLFVPICNWL